MSAIFQNRSVLWVFVPILQTKLYLQYRYVFVKFNHWKSGGKELNVIGNSMSLKDEIGIEYS